VKAPRGGSMKRAIIWFCWGEAYTAAAVESARSAASVTADRFLIVDRPSAAAAAASGSFTDVIAIDTVFRNNLEKSRLVDFVPPGYDSYLYLDTDAWVLGDVSLGFESAERFGIAVAPDPNYDLGAFFGFGELMAELGIEPRAQMVFNAGVIFFSLTAAVRNLLEAWRDLCATIGPERGYTSDQVFLSFALERLGFRPYVLSPSYNYRGFGEHAVGSIRIWHSHHPPPPDVNAFDSAWPGRRFMHGARLPRDPPPPSAAAPSPAPATRLPQGMFRLKLAAYADATTSTGERSGGRVSRLLATFPFLGKSTADPSSPADYLALAERDGSRAANAALVERIGLELRDHGGGYFAEALHYHLGLLCGYEHDPEGMADHIQRSRTMPAAGDDAPFSDHVNLSHVVRTRQLQGIERGLPAILVCSMQYAASAAFCQSLGRLLDLPVLRVGIGGYLVPTWLDMFSEGGAIAEDCFAASDFNLGVLAARGARDLFVLIRDPRAAAHAMVRGLPGGTALSGQALESHIERACVDRFIPWLRDWIGYADGALAITWLRHDRIFTDRAHGIRRVTAALATRVPAFARFADYTVAPRFETPFAVEDDHAWRRDVGAAARVRLWAACPPEIAALLQLEP